MYVFALLLVIADLTYGLKKICYLGTPCFDMDERWFSLRRPIPPPQGPIALSIQAYFYSRADPKRQYIVRTWPVIRLGYIQFDPKKMTYWLNHGYQNGGNDEWIRDLKDALLKREDCNVFVGDWSKGSLVLSFQQAVANLRMASWQFSRLLKYLIDKRGLDIKKLHLIGHSLGAQVCGQMGKAIPGILRITALDPSQPNFQGEDPIVRLKVGDALQIDAIHADAKPFLPDIGFGVMENVGDVDFWMNGGHKQPGCKFASMGEPPLIDDMLDFLVIPERLFKEALLCPHGRAQNFFIEAVNNTDCIMWGRRASLQNTMWGVSNAATEALFSRYLFDGKPCTYHSCLPVGLETFDFPARGPFVVTTNGFSPYCLYEPKIPTFEEEYKQINKLLKSLINVATSDNETSLEDY